VVDTNIIVSATIRNSDTRAILLHPAFWFFTPEYALHEIEEHYEEIREKTGLADADCQKLIDALVSSVAVIPKSEFRKYLPRARQIMQDIDVDDTSFIALAISFKNEGIWSEDKDFQRQNAVRIWKTRDLVDIL
jgi:predicted nucleic acid-binding protein